MGQLVYAAKVTHIPRLIMSEQPGPLHGCRRDATDGLLEVGRQITEAEADTVVILDTHWLSNAAYHVNGAAQFDGVFTSSEFPTQLSELPYSYPGNPGLAFAMAHCASAAGVKTIAHQKSHLGLEYGTLVPLHFMQLDKSIRIISVSGWCAFATIDESRRVGAAFRQAIEASENRVALIASGSLSHRIHDNQDVLDRPYEISDEFNRQCDLRTLELWQAGRWAEFSAMLPSYAKACTGEGWMHDTAMLLGSLGWANYKAHANLVTPYFVASGTGQVIAQLPVEPVSAELEQLATAEAIL
ncbi:3,4-dihydroxyphenylacetate 2,3-dioxygenase [Acidovorax sp. 106]|jgi:3,4-dihydroxyphenylacetate 2,3-dioxygenase|uniref:3,4-dihydroxyphenylacetate 2,3-dioxygenase n=1 Tax=Acidovorax sp. 106 TaxID=2135637 RepID=UPI000EB5654C|nr:3,4-dihydroxyphenylacetate 2,3-dioxygenase [Acidovorax sp. 106]RLJ37106.1 3,4-dihydroxyphenylacetate 2,3-dioxygenase [Acidovorax sp. 106]